MRTRQDYVNAGRAAREAKEVVAQVDELSDLLKSVFRMQRFLPTTASCEQLLVLASKPGIFFEYTYDPDRQYEQGEVREYDGWTLLLQNTGRIQEPIRIEDNQLRPSILKLFRGIESHDLDGTPRHWVREEFCVHGMERYWSDSDSNREGWYVVVSPRVDSATPPPNDNQNWAKV